MTLLHPSPTPLASPLRALRALRVLAIALGLLLAAAAVRSEGIDLIALKLAREESGLLLDYSTRIDLPDAVQDALLKGVPLYFVAQAEVYRPRWYWRDRLVTRAERGWRLAWQPLTRRYRLSLGSVSQGYDTLADALSAVHRASRWKLAEAAEVGDDDYLEFSLRLDTSQLPRPLQIGLSGQADWDLKIERLEKVPAPAPAP